MNDDIDTLEDIDTLGDSLDVLEASDPVAALIEVVLEECIVEPVKDLLERL